MKRIDSLLALACLLALGCSAAPPRTFDAWAVEAKQRQADAVFFELQRGARAPAVARAASKMFLVDVNKSPQGAYAVFGTQKDHGDEEILRAQTLIEQDLAAAASVEELARRVGMSRRNFVRRFKTATGNAPREYVQRARVEAAKRELKGARRSVAEVAGAVGYGDVVAFRKLFARLTGLTPADYRLRYGPRAAPAVLVGSARARRA